MCNINIDECAGDPCHNGGTCQDGINGFSCRCPEGYHDPTCLSEVDECDSNPCIHGVCRDGLNGCGGGAGRGLGQDVGLVGVQGGAGQEKGPYRSSLCGLGGIMQGGWWGAGGGLAACTKPQAGQ